MQTLVDYLNDATAEDNDAGRLAEERMSGAMRSRRRVRHLCLAVFGSVIIFTVIANSQTTNPAYLAQMPSVQRIRSEIQGAGAMDTAARQMGAFVQLQQMIQDLAGSRYWRNQLTPDEKRLLGEYGNGYAAAAKPYAYIQNSPSNPDKPKWYQMHAFYETDDAFRDDLLTRFCSPQFRTQYLQAKGLIDKRAVARSQAATQTRTAAENQRNQEASVQEMVQQLAKTIAQLGTGGDVSQDYVRAANESEAQDLWQRVLQNADGDFGNDEFGLFFVTPGRTTIFCRGMMTNEGQPYTVESRDGLFQLTVITGKNHEPWHFGLRHDGSLVSLNIHSFGWESGKKCAVDVVSPRPRNGSGKTTSAASGTLPRAAAPNDAAAYTSEADQYRKAKNCAKAIELYKKAISLRPSYSAQFGLGACYFDLGQYALAENPLREATKLNPSDSFTYMYLGETYFKEKKYEAAISAWKQANDPDSSLIFIGQAYLQLKQYPLAVSTLREATRRHPNDADAQFTLGEAYVEMGDKQKALQVYSVLRRLDVKQADQLFGEININH